MSKDNAKKAAKQAAKATAQPVVETKPVETKAVTPKRTSHLKLGPELLARKASDAEIKKAFTDSFHARGKTDQAWIDKRIKIYMHIAAKKAAAAAKSAAKTAAA